MMKSVLLQHYQAHPQMSFVMATDLVAHQKGAAQAE